MKHSNVPYSYSRVTFALSYAFREEFVRNSAIIWPLPSLVFLMTLNLSTCGEICICSPFFLQSIIYVSHVSDEGNKREKATR